MKCLSLGLPLVAALLFLACGGDDDNKADGQQPPPPPAPDAGVVEDGTIRKSDFASAYAHAYCDNVVDCCVQSAYRYSASTCMSARLAEVKAIAASPASSSYKADVAYSCVNATAAWARSCGADMPEVCRKVFNGTKKKGEPCTSTFDCTTSTEGGRASCVFGTCQETVPPKGGEVCGTARTSSPLPSEVGDCDGASREFVCNRYTQKCIKTPDILEDCSTSPDNCPTDTFCTERVAPGSLGHPKCVQKFPVGATCSYDDDCQEGSYCHSASHICAAKKQAGESCSVFGVRCEGYCTSGGRCAPLGFYESSCGIR